MQEEAEGLLPKKAEQWERTVRTSACTPTPHPPHRRAEAGDVELGCHGRTTRTALFPFLGTPQFAAGVPAPSRSVRSPAKAAGFACCRAERRVAQAPEEEALVQLAAIFLPVVVFRKWKFSLILNIKTQL